ncbi:RsmD family RNA methyltransferase [Shigella sonnei]
MSFLAQKGTPHNIVFVDPPFRRGLLEETINLLEDNGWLADEARSCRKRSRKRSAHCSGKLVITSGKSGGSGGLSAASTRSTRRK